MDRLAHCGLIPDVLQDVSNQLRHADGVVKDRRALFRGAEDDVRMWEKVWARRRAR